VALDDALGPILVADRLEPLEALLGDLLISLTDDEWERPTLVPRWRVKDVVAHLADTALRRLALCRDGRGFPVAGCDPARDLVAFVNRANADGVRFFRRLPARELIDVVGIAGRAAARYLASLDPMAPAPFAVSWAGDAHSPNWFDTARELTERWHHQQQIRLAVDRPGAMSRDFYFPVLDCFMRALPHWYRAIDAPEGTSVLVDVEGDAGGTWSIRHDHQRWTRVVPGTISARAHVWIPGDIAWRVFTKGIALEDAAARVRIEGDRALGEQLLRMTAIVG